jgi:gamma-glutamyl:cysteine ligase YbdK (ATP-grasp superfamily)
MDLFEPRSFSTDWEIMVIDRLERCVNTEKILAFSGVLSRELGLPINVDWKTLELALGVNTSFPAFWERVQQVTDRATQLLGEFDLDLFPAAGHPVERMFNAAHVHVGTVRDETAAIHMENQMLLYAPCFAALAANSPLSDGRRGGYKSYRVYHQANGDTRPMSVRDPQLYQYTWGSDAGPKLWGAPTVEVRIIDCASSRRFLAELATFVAAFVHQRGTRVEERAPGAREYLDALTNRWSASRHGLQATFLWNSVQRPVVEILDEMLDECGPALAQLGARREDFGLIGTMLQKRLCQADYALDLAERYPEPLSSRLRDGEAGAPLGCVRWLGEGAAIARAGARAE